MDKVALGPLFVPVLRFFPVNITPMLHIHLNLNRGQAEVAWEPPKKAVLFQISMSNAKNTVRYAKHTHTHTQTHTHTYKPVCQYEDVTVSWDRGVHTEK
jgi:hypothetical protein